MSFELVFEGYRMVFASCEGFDGLFFVQTCCFFASAGGRDFCWSGSRHGQSKV